MVQFEEPFPEPAMNAPLPFDPSGIRLDPARGLGQQLFQALRERNPDGRLAARLQLLYDGASVTGIRERSGLPALEAREMAQLLLERAAGQVDGRRVAGS